MGIVELPVCLVAVTTCPFNTGLIQTPPKAQSWAGPPRAHRHVTIAPRWPGRAPARLNYVALGPRMPTGIQDPLAQQQFRQPMPGPHQITTDIFPGPDQIPRRLLFHARHPDLDDLIHPQQLGKMLRVSRIGLDPITRRPFAVSTAPPPHTGSP